METEEHDQNCADLPHDVHVFAQETADKCCGSAEQDEYDRKPGNKQQGMENYPLAHQMGRMFSLKVGKGKTGKIGEERRDERQYARGEKGENPGGKCAQK
jgi:hypothetical protein